MTKIEKQVYAAAFGTACVDLERSGLTDANRLKLAIDSAYNAVRMFRQGADLQPTTKPLLMHGQLARELP